MLPLNFDLGKINYMQFKEFLELESTLTFALMDRDNNRSISSKEFKLFVKFMRILYSAVSQLLSSSTNQNIKTT